MGDPELTVVFQAPPREEERPSTPAKSAQAGRAKTSTKEPSREQAKRHDEAAIDRAKIKQKELSARHAAREAQKAKKEERLAEKSKQREALSRKQSSGLERLEERRRKEADVRAQITSLKAEEEEHSRSMDDLKRKEEEISRQLAELRRREEELRRKQEEQTKKKAILEFTRSEKSKKKEELIAQLESIVSENRTAEAKEQENQKEIQAALANVSDDDAEMPEETDEDIAMDGAEDEELAEQAAEEEIPRRTSAAPVDDTSKRLAEEASSALAVIERRRPVLEEPDSTARSRSGSNTIARRVPAATKSTPPETAKASEPAPAPEIRRRRYSLEAEGDKPAATEEEQKTIERRKASAEDATDVVQRRKLEEKPSKDSADGNKQGRADANDDDVIRRPEKKDESKDQKTGADAQAKPEVAKRKLALE